MAHAVVLPFRPRVTVIGGSTAAAAAGVDPHCSRVMLWLQVTGRVTREETEAMRWGTVLQDVIVDVLEREHDLGIVTPDEVLTDPERPWLIGHPDGYIVDDDGRRVLEVKTAGHWARWTDAAPLAYEAQVQTYLHLSGLDAGLLACLVGGQKLELRDVQRSQPAIDLLLSLMAEFMEFVRTDTPPPPDGSQNARDALLLLYPDADREKTVAFTAEQMQLVRELRELRGQAATLDVQVAERENIVRGWMGDASVAVDPHGETVAKWPTTATTRLDTARLKAERPDVYDEYANRGTTRRFTLA